jgi:preprotein translocase subunit SecD
MLYFQGWKLVLILGVCLLGFVFALPNAFAPATLVHWPSFLRHQISLGLDLRGGSHLLFEVDMNAVEQERPAIMSASRFAMPGASTTCAASSARSIPRWTCKSAAMALSR